MPPSAQTCYESCNATRFPQDSSKALLDQASVELEKMRSCPSTTFNTTSSVSSSLHPLPTACRNLILSLPGNNKCVDCGITHPQWASISYGCLLCLQCSGRHRSFGVSVSRVRSITMDNWSQSDVVSMLEGGNDQLSRFFDRHELSPRHCKGPIHSFSFEQQQQSNSSPVVPTTELRYKTKAARFYRDNMCRHAQKVVSSGKYRGREAARKGSKRRKSKGSRESNVCHKDPDSTETKPQTNLMRNSEKCYKNQLNRLQVSQA